MVRATHRSQDTLDHILVIGLTGSIGDVEKVKLIYRFNTVDVVNLKKSLSVGQ